eukprot:485975_1
MKLNQSIQLVAKQGHLNGIGSAVASDRFYDIKTAKTKETMDKCIYFDSKPLNYHNYFSSLDYGANHSGLIKLLSNINKDIKPMLNNCKYMDIGSSYGSTTLAIIDNMSWIHVGEFWKNEDLKVQNINNINVTAFDVSKHALFYGKQRQYFDNIICDDFNDISQENEAKIKHILYDCSILSMIGCSTYLRNCTQFFEWFLNPKAREIKEKLLLYECIHSFNPDRMNHMAPNLLFKDNPKWSYESLFCKHRNFTQQEREHFDGNFESWMHYFAVKFEKL